MWSPGPRDVAPASGGRGNVSAGLLTAVFSVRRAQQPFWPAGSSAQRTEFAVLSKYGEYIASGWLPYL
jgi:hypothetical protein